MYVLSTVRNYLRKTIRKLLNRYLKILDQAMASNQDMVLNDFDIE